MSLDILVVDDDRLVLETTATLLTRAGYSVRSIFVDPAHPDVCDLLSALSTGAYTAILLDAGISPPSLCTVKHPYGLAEKIRELAPSTILIAHTGAPSSEQYAYYGAIIPKPSPHLAETLHNILRRHAVVV